jgi:hypothetical protein
MNQNMIVIDHELQFISLIHSTNCFNVCEGLYNNQKCTFIEAAKGKLPSRQISVLSSALPIFNTKLNAHPNYYYRVLSESTTLPLDVVLNRCFNVREIKTLLENLINVFAEACINNAWYNWTADMIFVAADAKVHLIPEGAVNANEHDTRIGMERLIKYILRRASCTEAASFAHLCEVSSTGEVTIRYYMLAKFVEYLRYRSYKSISRIGNLVFNQEKKLSLIATVVNLTRNTKTCVRLKNSPQDGLWKDIQANSEKAFSGLQQDPDQPPPREVDHILHSLYRIQGTGAPIGGKLYQVASLLRNFVDHKTAHDNYVQLMQLLNLQQGVSAQVFYDKLLTFVEVRVPKFFYYFQDAVYNNKWARHHDALKHNFV